MPAGFLAVSSEPSAQLPLEEFHAWYEEEHIPLRLQSEALSRVFLSGARYHAIDIDSNYKTKPDSDSSSTSTPTPREGWLAMYEIDDTRAFGEASYTGLRERRSERERGVMARLGVLVRRTGEVMGLVKGEKEGEEMRTTGLKVGRPSGWVVTHGLNVSGDATEKEKNRVAIEWAENIVGLGLELGGWVRVRVVRVLESGKTMGAPVPVEDEVNMPYFIVHEFVDEESAMKISVELTRVMGGLEKDKGSARVEVGGWRVWKLYKAYPCLAQGNVKV